MFLAFPFFIFTAGCHPEAGNCPPTETSEVDTSVERQPSVEGYVYAPGSNSTPGDVRREPVGDAVVFLASDAGPAADPPAKPVTVVAKGGRLEPAFSCVVVGQKFVVKPVDDLDYHLSIDIMGGPPEPGIVVPRETPGLERVFSKPHLVALIRCAFHPQLRGYVTAVPTRLFARSREDGSFDLPLPLPPGKYELIAFHPNCGKSTREIDIRPGRPSGPITFVLPFRE